MAEQLTAMPASNGDTADWKLRRLQPEGKGEDVGQKELLIPHIRHKNSKFYCTLSVALNFLRRPGDRTQDSAD